MTNSSKPRDYSLDLLKVVGIYFVMLFHNFFVGYDFLNNPNTVNYLVYYMRTILSTCVPIFFFVNGALLLNKEMNLKNHTIKTIKITLMTVIWGIIILTIFMVMNQEYLSFVEFFKALWTLKLGWINYLWFLQALVVIYLFFPVIKKSFDAADNSFYFFLGVVLIMTFGNVILSMLANVLESILGFNYINGNFNFFNGFNPLRGIYGYSLAYFMLGGLLYKQRNKIYTKKNIIIALVIIPVCMLFATFYGVIMSRVNNNIYDVVWSGYDSIFTVLCVISFFVLSSLYKGKYLQKTICLISKNTLGIYFLHVIVGKALRPIYLSFSFADNILVNALYALMILFISLGFCVALKKIPVVKQLFLL